MTFQWLKKKEENDCEMLTEYNNYFFTELEVTNIFILFVPYNAATSGDLNKSQ